jgi:hypothetical protein
MVEIFDATIRPKSRVYLWYCSAMWAKVSLGWHLLTVGATHVRFIIKENKITIKYHP